MSATVKLSLKAAKALLAWGPDLPGFDRNWDELSAAIAKAGRASATRKRHGYAAEAARARARLAFVEARAAAGVKP